VAENYGFDINTPLKDAPEDFLRALFYGDDRVITVNFNSYFSGPSQHRTIFEGVVNNMERRYKETTSDMMRERIEKYMANIPCETCGGKKLNENSLAVTVGGLDIIELTEKSVSDCLRFFETLALNETEKTISRLVIKEIKSRLGFLNDVGLSYLSLSRSAASLSGGESQRIRLATQIGSKLTGVLYVLDEPSIGLHQRDNGKLIAALRNLTDIGNTLIVVEHDDETIRNADYIVDIGPGAGVYGGKVVAQGSQADIMRTLDSITGKYLSGELEIAVPKTRRKPNGKYIKIIKASENNLKNIDVAFPVGLTTCVTGVSGSGKSTLVNEILYKSAAKALYKSGVKSGRHERTEGLEYIDKVINIDQSPIGRTPRSNPATYTGTFDLIRDLFASTNESKMRGYKKGRFSFNVKAAAATTATGTASSK
jgi:excinuclease ABC subunit A